MSKATSCDLTWVGRLIRKLTFNLWRPTVYIRHDVKPGDSVRSDGQVNLTIIGNIYGPGSEDFYARRHGNFSDPEVWIR